jgi:hypothetical protein
VATLKVLKPSLGASYESGGISLDQETVLCVAAVIGVTITAIKTYWDIRKDRKTTRRILDHIKSVRKSVKRNEKAIEKLRIAVDGGLTTSSVQAIEERKIALKEAELARKKEQDEWNKVVAAAKGIGWFLDRMKEDEEEEEY